MKIHITNSGGFLGQYLQAESNSRGFALTSEPSNADVLILCGWRYSDSKKSLFESKEVLNKFGGKVVIGIGSQSELWNVKNDWQNYSEGKRQLSEIVLNSNIPVKSWIRLSSIAGRGMRTGRLVLDALESRRMNKPLVLKGNGNQLISVCDVKLVAKNILNIPESGTHIRNGWGERFPVSTYLNSWNVKFNKGEDVLPDTPPAFDSRDWNGWVDVGFSPSSFEELLSNYTETQEIV